MLINQDDINKWYGHPLNNDAPCWFQVVPDEPDVEEQWAIREQVICDWIFEGESIRNKHTVIIRSKNARAK